jgi:hypothetical protein
MQVPFWAGPIEAVLAGLAARAEGLTQVEAEVPIAPPTAARPRRSGSC